MSLKHATGPGAASRKYDVLSVLMAYALAGDKHRQRLVLRFMALITTRYNWQTNELSMGQGDIARLWAVDPRTVKRDMAKLRCMRWIDIKYPGARGRVSVYSFHFDQVLRDTRPHWENIGPDVVERLVPQTQPQADNKVVPLRRTEVATLGQGPWKDICQMLRQGDDNLFAAWFAPLVVVSDGPERLILSAPSAFHKSYIETHLADRLWRAIVSAAPHLTGFSIEC